MSLLDTASLIVTPNGYKEGKLYSVIPSDGSGDLSVTRATTATRVNSAGLVELVPYNLLSNTDTFSGWNLESGTLTGGFTAPDGSSTAYKYVQVGGNGLYSGGAGTSPDVKTAQIWIKSVSGGSVTCSLSDGASFIGTLNITGQWQLFTAQYAVNSNIGLYLYGISNAAGIYVWHPQVNNGTTALPYLATTTRLNIPRLDYSNGTCPSLLVEPQRTNVLTYSSSFNNWLPAGGSVTANTTTAPDGTMTADTLTGVRYQNPIGVNVWTFSCYAKANGGSGNFWLRVDIPATNETSFDLTNGTYSAPSGYTASIEDVGNGWYRCTMTTPSVNIVNAVVVSSDYGANSTYIWGAQFEAGNYSTSYIPTTSASVTRNADVISKTGISSLIGQTEGTIFWDGQIDGCQNLFANIINSEKNTTASFSISYLKSTQRISASIFASLVEYNLQGGSVNIGETAKVAYAYKSGNSALYVNGVQVASSSNTFTLPSSLDDIFIGDPATYFGYQEGISTNAAALWQTRLDNATLATLTTL